MNYYECSDGTKVSEATIKKRLSDSYRKRYGGEPMPCCSGCGGRAIETSHIIGKARCKVLHKTELIWDVDNMMPSCRDCHMKWEAINNPEWCSLFNVERLLSVVKRYDSEGYIKRMMIYDTERFQRFTTS